jgi:cell division septum initiation protein DivIVA
MVAEKFSLNSKKELLIDIVKRDYPRFWEENKQFLSNLQEIQEFRNKLAHSIVDVSDEALRRPLEDGIGFVQWKQGKAITDEEFQEWELKATMVDTVLADIKALLPYKEKPIS